MKRLLIIFLIIVYGITSPLPSESENIYSVFDEFLRRACSNNSYFVEYQGGKPSEEVVKPEEGAWFLYSQEKGFIEIKGGEGTAHLKKIGKFNGIYLRLALHGKYRVKIKDDFYEFDIEVVSLKSNDSEDGVIKALFPSSEF